MCSAVRASPHGSLVCAALVRSSSSPQELLLCVKTYAPLVTPALRCRLAVLRARRFPARRRRCRRRRTLSLSLMPPRFLWVVFRAAVTSSPLSARRSSGTRRTTPHGSARTRPRCQASRHCCWSCRSGPNLGVLACSCVRWFVTRCGWRFRGRWQEHISDRALSASWSNGKRDWRATIDALIAADTSVFVSPPYQVDAFTKQQWRDLVSYVTACAGAQGRKTGSLMPRDVAVGDKAMEMLQSYPSISSVEPSELRGERWNTVWCTLRYH